MSGAASERSLDESLCRVAVALPSTGEPERLSANQLRPLCARLELIVDGLSFENCDLVDLTSDRVRIRCSGAVHHDLARESWELRVAFDEAHGAYDGAVRVAASDESRDGWVFDLELLGMPIDIESLSRLRDAARACSHVSEPMRLDRKDWYVEGCADFKQHVADLRLFLEEAETLFASLERELTADIGHGRGEPPVRGVLHQPIEKHFATPFIAQLIEIDRAYKELPHPAREPMRRYALRHLSRFLGQSGLVAHAWDKPRGIPGDYFTMRAIYDRTPEGDTLLGKALSWSLISCGPPILAVRARKDLVVAHLRETVEEARREGWTEPLRVASIGSGPAEEFADLLSTMDPGVALHVYLLDQDTQALTWAYGRLKGIIRRRGLDGDVKIVIVARAVSDMLRDPDVLGVRSFDLVICTGLFDYLQDPMAESVMASIHEALLPGGCALVANMQENSGQTFLDLIEWPLIYRTGTQLLRLAEQAAPSALRAVVKDRTGIVPVLRMIRA